MEKNVRLGLLMGYYPGALTARQKQMMALHFDEDMSLAEIAEHEGVSRQAVHDAIRRGEAALESMEAENGLLASRMTLLHAVDMLEGLLEGLRSGQVPDKAALEAAAAQLEQVKTML